MTFPSAGRKYQQHVPQKESVLCVLCRRLGGFKNHEFHQTCHEGKMKRIESNIMNDVPCFLFGSVLFLRANQKIKKKKKKQFRYEPRCCHEPVNSVTSLDDHGSIRPSSVMHISSNARTETESRVATKGVQKYSSRRRKKLRSYIHVPTVDQSVPLVISSIDVAAPDRTETERQKKKEK